MVFSPMPSYRARVRRSSVKILYKGVIDNIIFLKRQQWIITNCSLVAFAYAISCMMHCASKSAVPKVRSGLAATAICLSDADCHA
jgi:hypothetical protein